MNCDKEILKLYVSIVSDKIYQKGNKLMNIIFLSEIADKAFIDYMKTRGTVILVPKDDRFDSRINNTRI
jgi:hypothetical protein